MLIKPSTRSGKKYMAVFASGKTVHFGDSNYEDFTTHRDPMRKRNYLARHSNEDWTNPYSAGTLSRYILWNLPTIKASYADYKKRFNI